MNTEIIELTEKREKPFLFYRWDNKKSHYAVVGVCEKKTEKNRILFRIPKSIPKAKEMAKHITHSLATGTMGIPIVKIIKCTGYSPNETKTN